MKNLQPPSDKKKKEEMLRKREQRMMQAMAERFVIIMFILWRLNICWLLPIYTVCNVHIVHVLQSSLHLKKIKFASMKLHLPCHFLIQLVTIIGTPGLSLVIVCSPACTMASALIAALQSINQNAKQIVHALKV